jgi:trans-aconitate 2-methyltransferase
MTSPSWDPAQYERFAAERARPFADLVARIPTRDPRDVVDLGCGTGAATASLARRWPEALVVGLDSSAQMLSRAAGHARPGTLEFRHGTIEDWRPKPDSLDVVVSNAALQWVPGHLDAMPAWFAALRPGGSLAIQVPAVGASPAADIFRTVAMSPRWLDRLAEVALGPGPRSAGSALPGLDAYVDTLARLGAQVDAWETTYLHVLPGEDPVLEWFAGTGLRPYLDALPAGEVAEFRAEVAAGLRDAYPPQPYGTVLPFSRHFFVATR